MSKYQYVSEPALVKGDHDFASITHLVTDVNLRPTPKAWYLLMLPANALLGLLLVSIGYLVWEGTGIWGLTNPIGWGWAIINFVWWVGIGHAGTLISAILFLFRQDWRTAINRFAEAMTIFAVMCALIFPAIHVGRIWVIYWVFPIPIKWLCGRTLIHPFFGTCLRYRPTLQFRYFFGMWGWFLIWQHYGIRLVIKYARQAMAYFRQGGTDQIVTGGTMKKPT